VSPDDEEIENEKKVRGNKELMLSKEGNEEHDLIIGTVHIGLQRCKDLLVKALVSYHKYPPRDKYKDSDRHKKDHTDSRHLYR
jgi:hypothetical protein